MTARKAPTDAPIAVVIRVCNRLEDLAVCLDLVRTRWDRGRYHVVVVANGASDGFPLPPSARAAADTVVELPGNPGHRQGSAELLREGVARVPDECPYTVLVEADTWMLSDDVVGRWIRRLEASGGVWASAEWFERYWSLAVDFAIVSTDYAKGHPSLFSFTRHPETWICNHLLDDGAAFRYLREAMPVHVPRSMRAWISGQGGRFRSFPHARMVTHHIENLDGGIDEKRFLANVCAGSRIFETGSEREIAAEHRRLCRVMAAARFAPRSRWLGRKRRRTSS